MTKGQSRADRTHNHHQKGHAIHAFSTHLIPEITEEKLHKKCKFINDEFSSLEIVECASEE